MLAAEFVKYVGVIQPQVNLLGKCTIIDDREVTLSNWIYEGCVNSVTYEDKWHVNLLELGKKALD